MDRNDYMKDIEDHEQYTHEYTSDVLDRLGSTLVCEEMVKEDREKFLA